MECLEGPEGHTLKECLYDEHILEEYRKSHNPDDGFAVSNVIYYRKQRHPEEDV